MDVTQIFFLFGADDVEAFIHPQDICFRIFSTPAVSSHLKWYYFANMSRFAFWILKNIFWGMKEKHFHYKISPRKR